ncbi:MAG: carboxylesterase type B, partial [Blastocatellia bacterium]
MKRIAFVVVLGGVVLAISQPFAMIPGQVRIDTGLLSGTVGSGQPSVRVFKGIPFAAPPLGENRWRAPQPAATWD